MLFDIREMNMQRALAGLKATSARELLMMEDIAYMIGKGTSKSDAAVYVNEFVARMNDEQVQKTLMEKYRYEWNIDRWLLADKLHPYNSDGSRKVQS